MRTGRSTICTITSTALALAAHAGTHSYVESSNGLQTPSMEGGRTELEFGDVDGDGHVDVVCIGDHGSPFINSPQAGLGVWFGNGSGQWSSFQTGNFGYGGVALGDVNNDGLMDAGYGMHHNYSGVDFGDQVLEVALGDGTGMNWTPWDDGLGLNGQTWGMFATDFADINNDGLLDVGSVSFGCCDGIHVHVNQGDGTWPQSFAVNGGNSSMIFVFGDVNGDGLADFAVSHGSGTVYLGDGRGGFTLADGNLPGSAYRTGVSLGDVNGDGRDDLSFNVSGGIAVYTMGSPGVWQDLSGSLASTGSFSHTEIADMDNDGFGDVIALSSDELVVFRGDGAGDWNAMATITMPDGCGAEALRTGADVDHNGYPDIIRVTEENCGGFTGGTNIKRLYREATPPTWSWIHPVHPRGGETIVAGGVGFIDWRAAVPAGQGQPTMTIELSTAGAVGPFELVTGDVPNNGRYQWLTPTDLPTTNNAFLRFTLSTDPPVVATTPAPFNIVGVVVDGDLTGDGATDLRDVAHFESCFTGQEDGPVPPDCGGADLDGDGDVALDDYATLLPYLVGP